MSQNDLCQSCGKTRQYHQLHRPRHLFKMATKNQVENFTALRTDGRGDRLIPGNLYYVQDIRQMVGNCIMWWAKNRQGYTCNLKEAGLYCGDDVETMRSTDVPWPQGWVEEHVVAHVRGDTQAFDRTHYKPGPR